jgi:hypothetical protein
MLLIGGGWGLIRDNLIGSSLGWINDNEVWDFVYD